ncbi:MAG: ABC-type transport auxiliary lipoprotein family protein [Pseudomonadota bacterium]
MIRSTLVLATLWMITACSSEDIRFDTPAPAGSPEQVTVAFQRIEVLAVSLPSYAQTEEIYLRDASGAIVPLGPLWADEPERGLTLDLVRELRAVTQRLVAPDPWPFRDRADVRVDVRLDVFHATAAGTFRIEGQVFVAPEEAVGRDRARRFEIEVPVVSATNAASIAAARAAAVRELSVIIARDGLR